MRKANVRVEARDLPYNASREERDRNFRGLMSAFRQACNKAGIMKQIKKKEYYESPSILARRKKREKEATMLKLKLKELFPESANVNNKANKNNKNNKNNKPNRSRD
jgi:ribosomal protein S21